MPQRVTHDEDLATLPYVAFHPKTVQSENQIFCQISGKIIVCIIFLQSLGSLRIYDFSREPLTIVI